MQRRRVTKLSFRNKTSSVPAENTFPFPAGNLLQGNLTIEKTFQRRVHIHTHIGTDYQLLD